MSSEVFLLLPNIKNFPSKIEKPAEEADFWLSRPRCAGLRPYQAFAGRF
jgi:hypothetical protein